MHQNNIEQLSAEAQRLLKLTLVCYGELKQKSGMLVEQKNIDTKLKFTLKGIEQQIETLDDELKKLTQQEMVLAVVGTMKAGKSTTINAIVGTEVLPNRNRPMTALPTRICHTKGQFEPILYFPHTQPLNTLMGILKKALAKAPEQLKDKLFSDRDMPILITQIEKNIPFEKEYVGAENIFHCLKSLNDLVRLSSDLSIEFPFKEYATVEKIPTINVEFAHLSGLKDGYGQLTLLDTPGPNEAGQSHLEEMLKDQLGKASAVLTVMDYTQLKSTSDEDVRQAVSAAGGNVPIYALVNKFDQQDRHSDSAEQIKNLVSSQLMKGIIPPEHVFPVASKWGYLANRARHEIHLKGKLPSIEEQSWVEDFADEAIGKRWKASDLEDNNSVIEAADELWKYSQFAAPIQEIIQTAYSRAALFSLKSASNKLVSYSEDFREYITLRNEGIMKDISLLKKNVNALESDINLLVSIQTSVENEIKHKISSALEYTAIQTRQLAIDLNNKTEAYFEAGKLELAEQERKLIEANKKRRPKKKKIRTGIASFLSAWENNHNQSLSENRDFDPSKKKLEFAKPSEAREFIDKVEHSIAEMLSFGKGKLHDTLTKTLSELEFSLTAKIQDKISPLEQRIHQQLEESGFSIQLKFPIFNIDKLNFSTDDAFEEAVKREEKTVTHSRRQSGVWGTVCGWFNTDDWGWEDYQTTEEKFVVKLASLKSSISNLLNALIHNIDIAIKDQVEQPINNELVFFFTNFTEKLEDIRANLQQSITVQQSESELLEQIKHDLSFFSKKSKEIANDSDELKKEVNELENEI